MVNINVSGLRDRSPKTMNQYRILITGSRDWDQPEPINGLLLKVWDDVRDYKGELVLVHGTAPGADLIAAEIFIQMMDAMPDRPAAVEPHPADWRQYGKQAGYVRNAEMVAAGADICLAFSRNNSRGTAHTIKLAQKAGIPTLIVTA